ncbi:MAG: branched-chain amino acid ABC transporter permease [Chloroflexi bacterium]|nr:branched-chain amino acid ABC transporter permease [Chloroflexota bacterium]MCI0576308.1 branched-chain amino acid ABC transporter permease [Chloroflexota bacterium]MCI0650023.1 branched-chain amino acid ABC transporter permease [Chloroflexota bacterium]MCI0730493.1 branched-chain amino acid ABC transporter permease [Chloroflexota bacterium]
MSYETIFQNLVFGLFVGSIYGVAAVGLALVFGVLKVLNVAHGELLMIGGYVTFWLFRLLDIDPFLSLLITGPVLFLFGVVLDRALFRHVVRLAGETKIKNSLLVSFGLTLILQNAVIQLFTADERGVQAGTSGALNIAGVILPYTRLVILVVALVAILALHLFLQYTYTGKAIRATAEDWEAAALAGINIQRIYLLTFGLGAALAGVAGTLVTVIYGVAPGIGLAWTLRALVVIVLAGTGSILGAFPVGLLLGAVEALSGTFIGPAYRELVGLVIFLLTLLLRPKGLFGR